MIEITRSLAKQFRNVVRRSILAIDKHATNPILTIRGDRTGLRLQAQTASGAVEYCRPGNQPNEFFHLPLSALEDFEGKKETTIQFTKQGAQITANWLEGVVPHERHYDEPENKDSPLATPKEMMNQPQTLVAALQDACESAAKASDGRYGLGCVQFRGSFGDLIGTDGSQLLRQGGFTFPWKDDVLIPAMPVFGCKELTDAEVAIGKTGNHVYLRVGPWKLHIAIDKVNRFPRAENILPSTQSATRVQFDEQDAKFLTENLSSLPGAEEGCTAVTIDANGQVLVRGRASGQAPTEFALVRSATVGKNAAFAVNRDLLNRALRLGFRSLHVHATDRPVLFHDGNRDFVTMPLGQQAVVGFDKRATRLLSTDQTSQPPVVSQPAAPGPTTGKPEGQTRAVNQGEASETNGSARQEINGIAALIDEAEALKDLLRDGYSRVHNLIAAAKRYRKQARVVTSTLASLRDLQKVAA